MTPAAFSSLFAIRSECSAVPGLPGRFDSDAFGAARRTAASARCRAASVAKTVGTADLGTNAVKARSTNTGLSVATCTQLATPLSAWTTTSRPTCKALNGSVPDSCHGFCAISLVKTVSPLRPTVTTSLSKTEMDVGEKLVTLPVSVFAKATAGRTLSAAARVKLVNRFVMVVLQSGGARHRRNKVEERAFARSSLLCEIHSTCL